MASDEGLAHFPNDRQWFQLAFTLGIRWQDHLVTRYKDTRESKDQSFQHSICFVISLRTNTKSEPSRKLLHCGCTLCVSHLPRQLGPTHSRGLMFHIVLFRGSPVNSSLPHAKLRKNAIRWEPLSDCVADIRTATLERGGVFR